MSSSWTPYNFTISDQSPLFQYVPYRDGPLQSSWNVTYAYDTDSAWAPDSFIGAGPSSHRTMLVGASAQLDWIGTAIYLYGEGYDEGYTIELDDTKTTPTSSVLGTPGLLFSQSNLTYGPHSLVLRVVRLGATISNATITVGMGEPGTVVQNHTIETDSVPVSTDGFELSHGWITQPDNYADTGTSDPRIGTTTRGASISFPLKSASAFSVVGSVNYNHGLFNVTVTSPSSAEPVYQGRYNGSSRWIGLDTTLYLATGLNRSQTYQVEMMNDSPGWLDISRIVVFDTPPQAANSGTQGQHESHALGTPKIVGIAIGGAFVLMAFVIVLFYIQRWRQRDKDPPDDFMIEHDAHSATESLPASYVTPFPWVDYPPDTQYELSSFPVWGVDQSGSREEPRQTRGQHTPSTSGASQLDTHLERAWASGLTLEFYEQGGQVHDGATASKHSLAAGGRLRTVSGRSSVRDPSFELNERSTVSSRPNEVGPVPDTPPPYDPWEEQRSAHSSAKLSQS